MGMIIQNGKVFSGEPKTTYTERVLWSGSETPTLNPGTDITLSDDLYSYDEIVIETYNSAYNQHAIVPFTTSSLQVETIYLSVVNQVIGLGVYVIVNSGNSIKIKRISSGSEAALTYTKIIGIKYGDTVKRKDYHVYSTEEKIVGEWIDGRTVYEKTLNVGTISSGTTVAHGITNLDWIIDYSLFGLYGGSDKRIFPSHGSSSSIGFVISSWDSTNITFIKGNLSSDFSNCYCTIRYTKSS